MHPTLRPIPFHEVELQDRFLNERLETVLRRTIPSQHRQLEPYGYFETLDVTTRGGEPYGTTAPSAHEVALTAVPYFRWANREPGPMTVWIREGGPQPDASTD